MNEGVEAGPQEEVRKRQQMETKNVAFGIKSKLKERCLIIVSKIRDNQLEEKGF